MKSTNGVCLPSLSWPRILPLFSLLLLLLALTAGRPAAGERPVRIGVLATRGSEHCLSAWSPTAAYLSDQIAEHVFTIVPLSHAQIGPAVRAAAVDFILTNPSFYVELEQGFGVNRIATMKERRLGRVYSRYGSVIFCRSDRTDIRTLADLKGKSFMGVSEGSLGGWLMAWRELLENGIDPHRDFAALRYGETHDEVVYAVRDGLVDVGTVRTNTLESMSAEGRIDLSAFFAFPRLHGEGDPPPYLCTTREYPDWPIAKLKHTPDELAEKVAVALLRMEADSPATRAAGCAGWTIPLNYQSVMECMMALRVGPYKDLGKVTVADLLSTYWPWILAAFIVVCSHGAFTGLVLKLNRKIKASHETLSVEIEQHRRMDKELEKAKEEAEAATLAKSQFLANMSHEIRTPMNGIVAATELALAEELAPEVLHYLHIVQNSSYALLGIINDILDFSKIEAGQLELKKRVFRLDEMLDRVMDVFVNQAAEKDIELLVDIDTRTPRFLHGDPLRLQQIVTNLIGNAIKFTGANGMILTSVSDVSASAGDLSADQVMLAFSVKDTGTGISPDYLPSLFEPFTQGDSSSTRKFEGTGLGLSICKKFVTMMHGSIGVDSVLGQGSTFSFTVRLEKAGTRPATRYVFPPDLSGLRVLVVDDSADSRDIMARMLISLGFKVETLPSGGEAIRRLESGMRREATVDLVLMDWKMAGMDGLTAAQKIRRELHMTMPIIIMTAFAREVHKTEAEQAGANGFLTKPIFQSTLFDAIMDAFGKEGPRKSGPRTTFTTRASMYRKHLKGCSILVAEDNLTNKQVAQAILAGAGIKATIVDDGEQAVAAVTREAFDAVLMDIQMPRMNGYEATRRIRAVPGGTELPIVAMTAHAMKDDEEKCLEAGMDGYITKPINQDRLFYTLWRLLRDRQRVAPEHGPELAAPLPAGGKVIPAAAGTPPPGKPPAGHPGLSDLDGFDLDAVLRGTGLDPLTLRAVLAGFARDNRQTGASLQCAWEENDREALLLLAHSLKGSSATIGARALQRAATVLETACSGSGTLHGIDDLVRGLQHELERVLGQLEPLLVEPETELSGSVEDGQGADLNCVAAALAEAIDRSDPEATRIHCSELIRRVAGSLVIDPALLKTLEAQTSRYDYDEARKTMHLIMTRVEALR